MNETKKQEKSLEDQIQDLMKLKAELKEGLKPSPFRGMLNDVFSSLEKQSKNDPYLRINSKYMKELQEARESVTKKYIDETDLEINRLLKELSKSA